MKSCSQNTRTLAKALMAAFFSIFFCFSLSFAANHYVDKSASGSSNGTSWSNAWKSFSSIDWTKVSAGDTIYISGGSSSKTYTSGLIVGKSGSSGAPIVITKGVDSGHNGNVIIDGKGSVSVLVGFKQKQYVTVSGLTLKNTAISNAGRAVEIDDSSNIVVEGFNINIQGRAGIFIQESSNCVLKNNRMETVSYVVQQTDGIYSQRNQNCIYDGNRIIIHNTYADGHNDCIQSYLDHSLIIRNNYGAQTSSKQKNAQGIFCTTLSGTFQIYNNIIYMPNSYNSCIATKTSSSGYHVKIFSNTVIGSKWGSIKVENDDGKAKIQNNIAWDYNGGSPLTYAGSTSGVHSNIFYQDPKLDADFRPQSGSPAINAGATLGSPYDWCAGGVSRPQGEAYDCGAYEVVVEPIDPPPAPPRNLRIVAQ
jgi:parallel beta-helix repeat protein